MLFVTPILSHDVNFNAISGKGLHVALYPNFTGLTSSTKPAIGPVWSSISGLT